MRSFAISDRATTLSRPCPVRREPRHPLVTMRLTLCWLIVSLSTPKSVRVEREKDQEVRKVARLTLAELRETLAQALSLLGDRTDHPGIKPQADDGKPCFAREKTV